ncbi:MULTISPECIES: hypothetical protein [Streptomyces]|nr:MULTISPECIES: hypothetical protein [Streptomyces]
MTFSLLPSRTVCPGGQYGFADYFLRRPRAMTAAITTPTAMMM